MPAARSSGSRSSSARGADRSSAEDADGVKSVAEQLANLVFKPLDLVVLRREHIQAALDEAAERGRITRSDANELVAVLVKRGRQQSNDLLANVEQALERGRERIIRGAGKARRSVAGGPALPISGYDELTAAEVQGRLTDLSPAELRRVRDYERQHANRKSVLAAVEKALA